MSTFNGIGSTYIGCAEVERDGSYVATKWLSIVIPIFPLGSVRVWPQSHRQGYFPVFYSSARFETMRVPLYWPHIVKMYGTYLAIVLFFKLVDFLTASGSDHNLLNPVLSSVVSFVVAAFAIKFTKPIRQINNLTNIVIVLMALALSFLFAANISSSPASSWTNLYYLWGAYAIFGIYMYFREEPATSADTKKRR